MPGTATSGRDSLTAAVTAPARSAVGGPELSRLAGAPGWPVRAQPPRWTGPCPAGGLCERRRYPRALNSGLGPRPGRGRASSAGRSVAALSRSRWCWGTRPVLASPDIGGAEASRCPSLPAVPRPVRAMGHQPGPAGLGRSRVLARGICSA